jgi:hypothetical protein
VAPIALYPDSLVAQILAASTFPEQLVDADRWVQTHPDLKGEALAHAVDPQPWDPSIKALTAFPAVLGNMDKNLSWTSALGDAYYNQEQDVMDAIQVMRRRAQQAGILNSTSQQIVTTEGSDIQIEPVSPEIVYVPAYDPWIVYGGPIVAWPGWYPYPGVWYDGPAIFFGAGFGIGFFGHYGGAGTIGVSIGITTTQFSTATGITPEAERSTIATDFIEAETYAAVTTEAKEGLSRSASITRRLAVTIVPKERQSLLAPIVRPLEAMPNLAVRAVLDPVLLAASATAERNEASRRAGAPASAAAVFTAVAAFTVVAAAERVQL